MAETKHLVFAVCKFLEEQQFSGNLSADGIESLEVASQCLQTAFEVNCSEDASRYPLPTGLLEIFLTGLLHMSPGVQPPNEDDKKLADECKAQGNDLMRKDQYKEALECYSRAIEKDQTNAVYYSNRAAAFSKMNEQQKAIDDCLMALRIDPNYSKAYGRKGLAHTALNQHRDAIHCYTKALELDPSNDSYKNNLELAEQQLRETGDPGVGSGPLGGMNLGGMDIGSLLNNPTLMNMASSMMSNPQMQQMMASMMSGGGGGSGAPGTGDATTPGAPGLDSLMQVGQQLAQQMQETNPELVEQLRQQMQNSNTGEENTEENNDSPNN